MSKKVIITGGCGFIGHHVVEHLYIHTDWEIIILDKLSYASNGFERLREIFQKEDINTFDSKRIKIYAYDLQNEISEGLKQELGSINYIIHMAAETHVDNSIKEPKLFIQNNIMSTYTVLEYAREQNDSLELLIHFSTDEVYGPAKPDENFTEDTRHNPTNPYSASKSACEQICSAYRNTYNVPMIVVNVMNAFGERQHIEKFIPMCMKKIINGEPIKIHTYPDGQTSGSRFFLHCRNIASAVLFLIQKGKLSEYYNIGGTEIENQTLALKIYDIISKFKEVCPVEFIMTPHDSSRPGHDLRYSLDDTKLRNLGWTPPHSFETSLENTIKWTMSNERWLK